MKVTGGGAEDLYLKAKENCPYVLRFLWVKANNLISHITCLADSDNIELIQWGNLRHHTCVLPTHPAALPPLARPPPGLPPIPARTDQNVNEASDTALQELSGNIKNQTEVLQKMRQDRPEENREKSNKFDSLHKSIKGNDPMVEDNSGERLARN